MCPVCEGDTRQQCVAKAPRSIWAGVSALPVKQRGHQKVGLSTHTCTLTHSQTLPSLAINPTLKKRSYLWDNKRQFMGPPEKVRQFRGVGWKMTRVFQGLAGSSGFLHNFLLCCHQTESLAQNIPLFHKLPAGKNSQLQWGQTEPTN